MVLSKRAAMWIVVVAVLMAIYFKIKINHFDDEPVVPASKPAAESDSPRSG